MDNASAGKLANTSCCAFFNAPVSKAQKNLSRTISEVSDDCVVSLILLLSMLLRMLFSKDEKTFLPILFLISASSLRWREVRPCTRTGPQNIADLDSPGSATLFPHHSRSVCALLILLHNNGVLELFKGNLFIFHLLML